MVLINPDFTFDNFVVGQSNQLAYSACMTVAENPGALYNLLFICDGGGLGAIGQTHLLHAIAHYCLDKNPEMKVCLETAENFTNELIQSLRYSTIDDFRERHRNADILLIDDIQSIAGRERTQEEIYHTFKTLFEQKKQIVVTCSHAPFTLQLVEERIKSFFEWGLIVDIELPDTKTKIEILKRKKENQDLPAEIVNFLARNAMQVRQLEGCIVKLKAYSSLGGRQITLELAEEVLKDYIRPKKNE